MSPLRMRSVPVAIKQAFSSSSSWRLLTLAGLLLLAPAPARAQDCFIAPPPPPPTNDTITPPSPAPAPVAAIDDHSYTGAGVGSGLAPLVGILERLVPVTKTTKNQAALGSFLDQLATAFKRNGAAPSDTLHLDILKTKLGTLFTKFTSEQVLNDPKKLALVAGVVNEVLLQTGDAKGSANKTKPTLTDYLVRLRKNTPVLESSIKGRVPQNSEDEVLHAKLGVGASRLLLAAAAQDLSPLGVLQLSAEVSSGESTVVKVPGVLYSDLVSGVDLSAGAYVYGVNGFTASLDRDFTPERYVYVRELLRYRAMLFPAPIDPAKEYDPYEPADLIPNLLAAAYGAGSHPGVVQAFNHSVRALRINAGLGYRHMDGLGDALAGSVSLGRLYRLGRHQKAPGLSWQVGLGGATSQPDAGADRSTFRSTLRVAWQDHVPTLMDSGVTTKSANRLNRFAMIRWRWMVGAEYSPRDEITRGDEAALFVRYRYEPGLQPRTTLGAGGEVQWESKKPLRKIYGDFWEYSLSLGKSRWDTFFIGFRVSKSFGIY